MTMTESDLYQPGPTDFWQKRCATLEGLCRQLLTFVPKGQEGSYREQFESARAGYDQWPAEPSPLTGSHADCLAVEHGERCFEDGSECGNEDCRCHAM